MNQKNSDANNNYTSAVTKALIAQDGVNKVSEGLVEKVVEISRHEVLSDEQSRRSER